MISANNPQSPDPDIILKILAAMIDQMQASDRAALAQRLNKDAGDLMERSASPDDGRRLSQMVRRLGL